MLYVVLIVQVVKVVIFISDTDLLVEFGHLGSERAGFPVLQVLSALA